MTLPKLTPKETEVLSFIKGFMQLNGRPPTIGEITQSMGYRSPAPTMPLIRALNSKGYLTVTGTQLEVLG